MLIAEWRLVLITKRLALFCKGKNTVLGPLGTKEQFHEAKTFRTLVVGSKYKISASSFLLETGISVDYTCVLALYAYNHLWVFFFHKKNSGWKTVLSWTCSAEVDSVQVIRKDIEATYPFSVRAECKII